MQFYIGIKTDVMNKIIRFSIEPQSKQSLKVFYSARRLCHNIFTNKSRFRLAILHRFISIMNILWGKMLILLKLAFLLMGQFNWESKSFHYINQHPPAYFLFIPFVSQIMPIIVCSQSVQIHTFYSTCI